MLPRTDRLLTEVWTSELIVPALNQSPGESVTPKPGPCRYTVTLRSKASLRGQRIQESMGREAQALSSSGLSIPQVKFKV